MHAKFARTLRLHMRDADLYTNPGTHVWTAEDSEIADLLLQVVTTNPTENTDENLLSAASTLAPALEASDLSRVWTRMQSFPYIFEVAAARKNVETLTLQGRSTTAGTISTLPPDIVTQVHYRGWHVNLRDFTEFRLRDKLSP